VRVLVRYARVGQPPVSRAPQAPNKIRPTSSVAIDGGRQTRRRLRRALDRLRFGTGKSVIVPGRLDRAG